MGVARGVEINAVLLVRVAASRHLVPADGLAVVTAVDDTVHRLTPPAAAVQRACIASEPVIAHPPAVSAVVVRAMTVAVRVELVRVWCGTVRKVAVAIAAVPPTGLRHDATEPALPAAVDRSIKIGGLDTLDSARSGKGARAGAVCRQDGLGGRVVVVADVCAKVIQVVCPWWSSVVCALLRWALRALAPPVAVASGGGRGGGWWQGGCRRWRRWGWLRRHWHTAPGAELGAGGQHARGGLADEVAHLRWTREGWRLDAGERQQR
mmetsp:Transcript_24562/g.81676  ORF Transcript_24562/g.81676 Transcript_24562/m.81676 type:complete len:265 (+) Transcript_24562:2970-3764(+)